MTIQDTQPGTTLPLKPGRWVLDSAHSAATFSVRHLGLAKVRGRFNSFDAVLDVGETLEDTKVTATIDVASIDTGNADRDAHVCSPEMLHTDEHPELRFESSRISGDGDSWKLEGQASIVGQSHPFVFDVEFSGVANYPFADENHAGFVTEGELRRKDFGLVFPGLGPADNLLGNVIKFELDLQFVEPGE